jgi:hypothetical protein
MDFVDSHLFAAMWIAWALYWFASSRNVKVTARRESLRSRLSHIVPLLPAGILLWARHLPVPILDERFIPSTAWPFWTGAALTASGLLCSRCGRGCIWA